MDSPDPQAMLRQMLEPWHQAVAEPDTAQTQALQRFLPDYGQTEYGSRYGAGKVSSTEDYRRSFPVVTYEELKPTIDRVMAGDEQLLISEPAVGWAITRGTTQGESKFIPMTGKDLATRVSAGRAMMQYAVQSGRFDLFNGVNLNLNFPSHVGFVQAGERQISFGYSSGIYAKFVSNRTPLRSAPTQDEIDALGGGKTQRDWDARFALAYEKCREENVTLVGGVAPTAVTFGRYLKRTHNLYPKDLWQPQIMTLGSVPGINTRYVPLLRALYGPTEVREIYGATEGIFGQQRDDRKAWVPNYDLFFFEVETRSGVKMLHEMKPGELGSLIVSTPVLPRYRIGDLILAVQPPYYRCIGRARWWTPFAYWWGELSTINLGRL